MTAMPRKIDLTAPGDSRPEATTSGGPVVPAPRQRRRRRSARRGVALVLVLSSLSILAVMLAEFQEEASAELGSAMAERDALKAEYAARSAVNLSRLLIAAEPTIRKSLALLGAAMGGALPQLPVWELADELLGAFNDASGREAFSSLARVELDGATFELVVVDEDSKVNVNLPARGTPMAEQQTGEQILELIGSPEYDGMFEGRDDGGALNTRAEVCGAIVDWTDPNQDQYACDPSETTSSVAPEDAYYERLPFPYERKNAAFDSLEELHLVRGVDDDFWSTFVDPDPEDPGKRNLTVWGSGKVNINTARPLTLWLLVCSNAVNPMAEPFCTDVAQREAFLSVMSMIDFFLKGVPIFTTPKAFVRVVQGKGGGMGRMLFDMLGITPISQLRSENVLIDKLGTESKVFSIYATGVARSGKNESRVRIHTVVDFRSAPPPGQSRSMADLMDASGASGALPATAAESTTPGEVDAAALMEALTKDPGGNILYYRVD
jgi:general secretion pathway protein K